MQITLPRLAAAVRVWFAVCPSKNAHIDRLKSCLLPS